MAEEKGHAKNIANFAKLISILDSFGAAYNPSNEIIESGSLPAALEAAQGALADSTEKNAAESVAINQRAKVFESLTKLITRINNAAAANIGDSRFLENLASHIRKLRGERASAKPENNPALTDAEPPKTISASQMSFDNRIQNFAELIALLKTNADYAPNETELQTAALESVLADLRAKNTAAVNAGIAAANARDQRNNLLYNAADGLLARVSLIKKYIKSIADAESPQYKQIVALQFKKPGS